MRGGFTLIEVLVVLGIITVLIGIGVYGILAWRRTADINATAHQMIAVLNLARTNTVSSVNDANYGVHFEADRFVLFTGPTYDAAATDNEVHLLGTGLEIYDISVGDAHVLFDRIDGNTANAGSVSLRRTSDTSQTRTIAIQDSGLVGLSGTAAAPTDTRVADSRHLHLDLGWSIQSATTLTLNFGSVVENIVMADYFNADHSQFDYEGTVSVDGSSQELKIHTHALTPTDTLLSVHRDRRNNDKALTILIDGQPLVTYTASGSATVGSSGGTLTQQ